MEHILKNYTVLFADDDEEYSSKFSKTLSYFFKEVRTANNGEEAYGSFVAKSSDIIILDLQMPQLNGLQVTQKIRRINKDVSIFIITNYQDFESARKGYEYELVDFLVKPVSFEVLLSTLKKCAKIISEKDNKRNQIIEIQKDIFYDKAEKIFKNKENIIRLSNSEIIIFEFMLKNRGTIIKTIELENLLFNKNQNNSSIRNIIYKLRQKLPKDLITNIPRVGYLLK